MDKQETLIQLSKELVNIASIVSTQGEKTIAEFIFNRLSDIPYFKENPQYLIKQAIPNDPLNRFNVLALLNKNPNQETMVGIAHIDTVDVSDYGIHQNLAFSVDQLTRMLRKDTDSNDTLYGRGMLDMKSGVAIWMELLRTLSEETLDYKNLLVGFVVDEEGNSLGMRHAISMLNEWKQTFGLAYLGAIDTDYTTSHYPKDPHRYVYFGTVGKLLVSIIAVGKETHASDPFLGIDANLMMAHIIDEINLNPVYTDTYQEQTTPPPIILHTQNPKQEYSVKTNKIASTQFNLIMANSSIEQWMNRIKEGVKKSLDHTQFQLQSRLEAYCQNNGFPYKKEDITFDVLFADELDGLEFNTKTSDEETLINYLRNKEHDGAYVVIGLTAPYYPAHTCDLDDKPFVDCIMNALIANPIDALKVEAYYPYISDLSYLRSPNESELKSLKKHVFNTRWIDETLWAEASQLNLPIVNIGPYGYDAHKKEERLLADSVLWVYEVIHSTLTMDDTL